jgi:hypothetical protein
MDAVAEGRESMSDISQGVASPSRRRARGRLAAWLAFGVVGIAMGAVWATGFASIGGATGTDGASPILTPSSPAAHAADLAGTVTPGSAFTVDWAGRWGSAAATNFFTVDLSGKPATQTYNVAFLLSNDISNGGWTSLQLLVENKDIATGPCVASAFDGTNRPKVLAFDSLDAGVYWNGLAGGSVYCIGIAASDGNDPTGTFLRRASDTTGPGVYPTFVTTVDRAS